jgi:hypothetical protein
MSELSMPKAARLQRPRLGDARLVVGVLLVLGSIVLGSLAVGSADDRVPVYAARGPLVPGQRVTEDDLTRVDVHLGSQAGLYLSAAAGLGGDRYALREVRAGELVPAASLARRDEVGVQPLTLDVDAGSAAPLRVGSQVDVYVNPPDPGAPAGHAAFRGPELVLHAVSVSSLPRTSSGLGGQSSGDRPVQVMAPTERVRDLIGQVDLGARVTLVPVAGTALRVDQ